MSRIWGGGVSEEDNPNLEDIMVQEDNLIDSNIVEYEILGLIAYHLELSKNNVLPPQESIDILNSLTKLIENPPSDISGFEDVHSLVDSRINEMSEYGQDLRIFLSRNDQSHFDIRSFYADELVQMSMQLLGTSYEIKKKFAQLDGYMPGYTHYRQAMPVSFQTYFDYTASVLRDLAQDCLLLHTKLTEKSPLGYGSGYGSSIPVDPAKIGVLLGFGSSFANPMHGSYYRGMDDLEMSFLLSKIMVGLSRISQDLILYSSDEFGFLKLPDGYTTGSSLMPNKRNPDYLEMIQGYASESAGTMFTATSVLMNKGSGYHREFQLSKDKVIAFTKKVMRILVTFEPLMAGLKVNSEKARELVANSTYATMAAYEKFKADGKWKDSYRFIGTSLKKGDQLHEYSPDTYNSCDINEISSLIKKVTDIRENREKQKSDLLKQVKDLIVEKR